MQKGFEAVFISTPTSSESQVFGLFSTAQKMCLGGERKPEHAEEANAYMEKTRKRLIAAFYNKRVLKCFHGKKRANRVTLTKGALSIGIWRRLTKGRENKKKAEALKLWTEIKTSPFSLYARQGGKKPRLLPCTRLYKE